MIAYKLCSEHEINKFFSFNDPTGRYSVEYQIGEWTYPKLGLLFVFNTLENAERYQRDYPHNPLFECEVGEVFEPKDPTDDTGDWSLIDYWINGSKEYIKYIPGSYVTEKIKLLRRVKPKAYKLVSAGFSDGSLRSFNAPNSSTSVSYKLNEWAYPKLKNSLLYVFDNLSNAQEYAQNSGAVKLYECEVGEVFEPANPLAFPSALNMQRYWNDNIETETLDIPGTRVTDKVKLIKQVNF